MDSTSAPRGTRGSSRDTAARPPPRYLERISRALMLTEVERERRACRCRADSFVAGWTAGTLPIEADRTAARHREWLHHDRARRGLTVQSLGANRATVRAHGRHAIAPVMACALHEQRSRSPHGQPDCNRSARSAARADASTKDDTVYTATAPHSTASFARQRASLAKTMASDQATGRSSASRPADPGPGYEPILLLAALEEIEVRRVAIEWLVEADLLRVCLA